MNSLRIFKQFSEEVQIKLVDENNLTLCLKKKKKKSEATYISHSNLSSSFLHSQLFVSYLNILLWLLNSLLLEVCNLPKNKK